VVIIVLSLLDTFFVSSSFVPFLRIVIERRAVGARVRWIWPYPVLTRCPVDCARTSASSHSPFPRGTQPCGLHSATLCSKAARAGIGNLLQGLLPKPNAGLWLIECKAQRISGLRQRAMQLDLETAHFGNLEVIPFDFECGRREYKRAKTMASFEVGKSWPLAVLPWMDLTKRCMELRIDFDQQMNGIGHDFHGHDFRPVFLGDFSKHLSASFLYRPFEHFALILGGRRRRGSCSNKRYGFSTCILRSCSDQITLSNLCN
jgi:hypothetical protein